MKVVSVQIGKAQPLTTAKGDEVSGIDKRAVPSIVVGANGVESDVIIDVKNHGGPDQAVYLYSAEDYAWWEGELKRPLGPGSFGENITLDTFGDPEVRIGDRFMIDEVVLEVTAPRIPCNTLSAHVDISDFVKTFRDARRPGLYARVITDGPVAAGAAVTRTLAPDSNVTVLDVQDLYYDHSADRDRIEYAAKSPVAVRVAEMYVRRLSKL